MFRQQTSQTAPLLVMEGLFFGIFPAHHRHSLDIHITSGLASSAQTLQLVVGTISAPIAIALHQTSFLIPPAYPIIRILQLPVIILLNPIILNRPG